jgi:hypothetical protein
MKSLGATVLCAVLVASLAAQGGSVVHITVAVTDGAGAPMRLPRYALLISQNPSSAAPRRVVTGVDGKVDVRLTPGNYTIESDEPLILNGKSYSWTRTLDVGTTDQNVDFTADDADVEAATPASSEFLVDSNPSVLLAQWQNSVIALWTPTTRASGVVVDRGGFVATSQRAIADATLVEVQMDRAVKVAGRVLTVDAAADVAIVAVDPSVTAALDPLPLGCAVTPIPGLRQGQRLVTIGAPLRGAKEIGTGVVARVDGAIAAADFRLSEGSIGGPVFSSDGRAIGVSSTVDDEDERRRRDARIVPASVICDAIAAAKRVMPRPATSSARLPVEPERAFPADALKGVTPTTTDTLAGYRLSTSDFDVTLLTPPVVYGAHRDARSAAARSVGRTATTPTRDGVDPTDFGDWSSYFADLPPVLIVRVTPKLAEGFWTTLARGAAYTQGVALPPIRHFKPGFSKMRLFCGDAELVPIHPFMLAQRVSETDAVHEGLYVFDAQAVGPQCGAVRIGLYSEKDAGKEDRKAFDPKVVQRVWDDFAPWRSVGP